ncbi:zinc transporter ZIP domain-containing protein, putative [Plasmodium relictum]|uniref:Zinc transporter ZIP domain-containing protein, putative n=1 Tax=Plasmodium relictum TaxID=85471 RepID=A0A1J1H2F1_PLARL|nr:zinc transporter ZIP domain-containing protein, putative [Plasmodium relictum]CRG98869.1 zinc transporter ZIP domain-containing protein, putative [Plasmodium relictum]
MIPYIDKIFAFFSIFFVTLFGSIIPLCVKSYSECKIFNLVLGYSGGILLSGGLVHLLPEARKDLNKIKKQQNLHFNYPICEMFAVLGIFLIIIVEQISDYLIQKRKYERTEKPNDDNCCNECYNIFFYANKFDYINILNIIKNNKIEDNKMYFINLKNINSVESDKHIIEKICTKKSLKLGKMNMKYTGKKNVCRKIKVQDSFETNSKYKSISMKHNKKMLISKLNEKKKQNSERQPDIINDLHNHYEDDLEDGNIYFIQAFNDGIIEDYESDDTIQYNFNKAPIILLLAFSFHSIIEGITLGSVKNSYVTNFSIISHKAFASFSIGINLINMQIKKKKYILFMLLFSLMTPLGILLGLVTNIFASTSSTVIQFLPSILASIGSGTFVYISLFEIIGPLLYTYKIHNHCMHTQKNFAYFKIQYKIQIILLIIIGALSMFILTWYF